ncbi:MULTISPECIES: RloB family protein [unclassified Colwellia]|uniref:RloB family protein n=1 Tax=unclassified Colwellia TaxID=196834 RepID=UPI0015F5D9C8|nr:MULTISPECIES: RloB family protein [unclassified Colwellia]MBA6231989.1 RloB domain-containing protein [Colwellia sp. MB02u-7]MBA6235692.1 RloB domain-containing protein [Colwellia sp. MB02u-11]MBA6297988.1 RloB domain-containing protein [Colwellia sp. MB3u-22]MBA6309722.1 RloB domain-containing protein [Colwellia sp. MB3u-64]
MGTDNLFHKRKAKASDGLERRKARRASYDKVLIVCEGEKTEPNYFNELINFYKLNTANVEIDGTCGSSPKSVFERALELYQKEECKGDAFDKVYCVFDKDSHGTYDETLIRISAQKPRGVFHSAISVPCFEYWLLLHFQYTTKPYHATGSSSIGNEVLKDLKAVFPEYAKGSDDIFERLSGQLEFAKSNAQRSLAHALTDHTDNPTTYIHELVDYLQKLK